MDLLDAVSGELKDDRILMSTSKWNDLEYPGCSKKADNFHTQIRHHVNHTT